MMQCQHLGGPKSSKTVRHHLWMFPNPIQTRGADYTPHTTAAPPHPGCLYTSALFTNHYGDLFLSIHPRYRQKNAIELYLREVAGLNGLLQVIHSKKISSVSTMYPQKKLVATGHSF